jgi:hypothetical protein
MVIEYWNLEFIWDLEFVIWDFGRSAICMKPGGVNGKGGN